MTWPTNCGANWREGKANKERNKSLLHKTQAIGGKPRTWKSTKLKSTEIGQKLKSKIIRYRQGASKAWQRRREPKNCQHLNAVDTLTSWFFEHRRIVENLKVPRTLQRLEMSMTLTTTGYGRMTHNDTFVVGGRIVTTAGSAVGDAILCLGFGFRGSHFDFGSWRERQRNRVRGERERGRGSVVSSGLWFLFISFNSK
ncbi:Hypothetical predicted protein [Olea europaea subsp. europaea]|uniref:Uncharacterized protein n=1 Tax=Olea europaea subsp. europaea TaxID=158383 RepID=A0A8S0PX82_OLEEU|nr:Hypothetical predicted protein [Olea europaea subsp. europaea]